MPPSRRDSCLALAVVSSPHRFEGTEPIPTSFRECRNDEVMLLPIDMSDWRRNRPYEPRLMFTVLIYTYVTGVFSSRRIARRLHEDVAFRMLCGGSFPRYRTICEFRRRHLGDFRHLFLEVVRLAREAGMVKLGTVTVDGTKVQANAGKRKVTGHGRMLKEEKRLEAEIAALVDRTGSGRCWTRVEADAGGSSREVLADAGHCSEEELAALEERCVWPIWRSGGRDRRLPRSTVSDAQPRGWKILRAKVSNARWKWMADVLHGWIKDVMSFRRFGVRSLKKVRSEWDLVCLAQNAGCVAAAQTT